MVVAMAIRARRGHASTTTGVVITMATVIISLLTYFESQPVISISVICGGVIIIIRECTDYFVNGGAQLGPSSI